jgi:hypothetical protein
MTKLTTQKDMLDGIESNIEATGRHIHQLRIHFASCVISGETSERRMILQQLHTLEDNLELLKTRRMYALESVQ